MTAPTVAVTVTLGSQDGTPYVGVTVRARLDQNDVYQGIVISDQVEAVTDALGVAVLNCFPNALAPDGLGTIGTIYTFRANIPGGRDLNVQALVPNLACRIEDILTNVSPAEAQTMAAAISADQAAASAAAAAASAAQAEATPVGTFAANLAASTGAEMVGVIQTGTGAVQRTAQSKMREIVTFKDFGAVGDGVTDDTAAVQTAMDAGLGVISGGDLSYLVSAQINGRANTVLRDAKFSAPALPANAAALKFAGTDGAAQVLAASYAEGVFGMTVLNGAAFTLNGWAWLASEEYWAAATADNVKYGEFVQVTGIAGNVLTFGNSTLLKYETGKAATITPVALLENVRLENVRLSGPVSTLNHTGFSLDRCLNVTLRDCESADFDYCHTLIYRSVACRVFGGASSRTGVQEGLDYGVVVSAGCYDVVVDAHRGDAMRHLLSIGGSQGVSRHISAINCRGTNLTDAGLDAHSAVHEHTFKDNFLHFSDDVDTTMDGILSSGTSPNISGNHLYNNKRHGVIWQPETLLAFSGPISGIFADNQCDQQRNVGSTSGLLIVSTTVAGAASIAAVNITNQQSRGYSNNIAVTSGAAPIKRVSIVEPNCLSAMRGRSIYIAAAGADIDGVSIVGGHHETDDVSVNPVIDLIGTAPYYVKNWRVTASHLKRGAAGTVGLRLIRTMGGSETGMTTDNVATRYSVDADSSGYAFDLRTSDIVISTNSPYIVLAQDRCIISSFASSTTMTLPDATKNRGRDLYVKTLTAQTVVSASSNVGPIGTTVAGAAILPATAGAWALLVSNGTIWHVMQRGT